MKPPIPYFGAKATLADRIVSLLPAHRSYIEPYAGSLAVLLAKPRAVMETVNDLDGRLMTFWRILRDRPDELIRACALTPHGRAELEYAHHGPVTTDELEVARRVWVILTQGRAGTLRHNGWRHYLDPLGSSIGMPAYLDAYRDRLASAAERLMGVTLECLPALDIIDRYGQHPNNLLYIDPPYLGSTRTSTNYLHDMPRPADHRDLAEALTACRAAVVLSGYGSALYDELYADWDQVEIATSTWQGNRAAARVEVLWSNRCISAPSLLDELAATGCGT